MPTRPRAPQTRPLSDRILTAVADYTRLTGVTPSLHDLPLIVDAPLSSVRVEVQRLIADGALAGSLHDLKVVRPPTPAMAAAVME